ncbi:MAG: hypothetical protein R3C45_10330 [Phycisphaerales bacterium]
MPNMTMPSPMMNLLVFYHPHHPEQYAKVLDLVRRSIDPPAGQIVIEAMVLEISETGPASARRGVGTGDAKLCTRRRSTSWTYRWDGS